MTSRRKQPHAQHGAWGFLLPRRAPNSTARPPTDPHAIRGPQKRAQHTKETA